MKARNFSYVRATTLTEALAEFARAPDASAYLAELLTNELVEAVLNAVNDAIRPLGAAILQMRTMPARLLAAPRTC